MHFLGDAFGVIGGVEQLGEQDVELISSVHDVITLLRQHVSLAASLHVEL
jgi:hypothetical protein